MFNCVLIRLWFIIYYKTYLMKSQTQGFFFSIKRNGVVYVIMLKVKKCKVCFQTNNNYALQA